MADRNCGRGRRFIRNGNYGRLNYFDHKGDVDEKMIELRIGILRAKPSPETGPLRDWAITTIEKRGDFNFNAEQKTALRKQELPYANALASQIGLAVSQAIKGQPQP